MPPRPSAGCPPTWSTTRWPPTSAGGPRSSSSSGCGPSRSQLGKQIPQAQGEEKQALLARTKTLSADVKKAEAAQTEAEEAYRACLMSIPNPAADEAPAGGEDDYVVLEHVGTPA